MYKTHASHRSELGIFMKICILDFFSILITTATAVVSQPTSKEADVWATQHIHLIYAFHISSHLFLVLSNLLNVLESSSRHPTRGQQKLFKSKRFSFSVPELPKRSPIITGVSSRYRHGARLRGNCTSFHSKPVANLTWTINDVPVRFMSFRTGPYQCQWECRKV